MYSKLHSFPSNYKYSLMQWTHTHAHTHLFFLLFLFILSSVTRAILWDEGHGVIYRWIEGDA